MVVLTEFVCQLGGTHIWLCSLIGQFEVCWHFDILNAWDIVEDCFFVMHRVHVLFEPITEFNLSCP
jgi:hypothetical protein